MKPIFAASIVAGLSAEQSPEGRNLANAYVTLLLADQRAQSVLDSAMRELPSSAVATEVANAILSTSERLSVQRFGQR